MGIVFHSDVEIPADSPDHRQIMGLATAYWQSQAVYALTRTGIADALSDMPAPVSEIAATVGCDELSVARLLRYLAGLGVVRQDGDKYASTTKTSPLQSGSPFRELVLMFGDEFYRAWANFSSTIRTGRSSYHETYGVELFEFLGANPERAQRFDIRDGGNDRSDRRAVGPHRRLLRNRPRHRCRGRKRSTRRGDPALDAGDERTSRGP
jgi:hypothetical protein